MVACEWTNFVLVWISVPISTPYSFPTYCAILSSVNRMTSAAVKILAPRASVIPFLAVLGERLRIHPNLYFVRCRAQSDLHLRPVRCCGPWRFVVSRSQRALFLMLEERPTLPNVRLKHTCRSATVKALPPCCTETSFYFIATTPWDLMASMIKKQVRKFSARYAEQKGKKRIFPNKSSLLLP
jgi:hypothetical protein